MENNNDNSLVEYVLINIKDIPENISFQINDWIERKREKRDKKKGERERGQIEKWENNMT